MRAYLDHASTSPLRPAARKAMIDWLRHDDARKSNHHLAIGDPSRLHLEGTAARAAVEEARGRIAHVLGARTREVVFTSGATESFAMACWGAATSAGPHSVLAPVEHSAIREWSERGDHTLVGVDSLGRIDAAELCAAVRDDTGIVHCQWGNHEVGTLQPVAAVVNQLDGRAILHVDGSQAVGRCRIDFIDSGIDMVSVSAHKFGGPAGVGALVVRRGLRVSPLIVGGDQERARRAGMENVLALLGFAAALEEATEHHAVESRLARERTDAIIRWANGVDGVTVLGDPVDRFDHIVCLGFDDVEPQPILMGLDAMGVAVHSGSSCSSEAIEPSPVLAAMGVDAERSLRVSVGWSNAKNDVARFTECLESVLRDVRALRRSN